MDGWELALFAAAAYVAVSSLARLMRQRRDELTVELRRKLEAEKRRRQEERRRKKEKERRAHKKAA